MDSERSEEKHIEAQIRQLREAIVALENQSESAPCIKPEELWMVMKQKLDENDSVYLRIQNIMNGSFDTEQVKKTLRRLENDLHDLKNIGDSNQHLYDPFKHEITEDSGAEDSDGTEEDSPATIREKHQRPLTAYTNSNSK